MKKLSKWVAVFLMVGVAQNVALAFKPANQQHGHTMITKSILSPGGYLFGELQKPTGEVVKYVVPQFTVGAANAGFSDAAVRQIVLGVQSRDWSLLDASRCGGALVTSLHHGHSICKADGAYITGDIDDEDGHFDNDNFKGSTDAIHKLLRSGPDWEHGIYFEENPNNAVTFENESVTGLLKKYVKEVKPGGVPTELQRQMLAVARMKLGKALHTLQDFYAHSTWADFYELNSFFSPLTDNLFNAVSQPDFQGYVLAASVLGDSRGGIWQRDVCVSRKEGNNTWLNNGGNYELNTNAQQARVISTSAWNADSVYGIGVASADVPNNVRCDHGVDTGNLKQASGIAKDAPYMPFNPNSTCTAANSCDSYGSYSTPELAASNGNAVHLKASYQAAMHSVELLKALIRIIQTDRTISADQTEADRMVAALLGVDEPPARIALVVDASATMSKVILGISAAIGSTASTSGISLSIYDESGVLTSVHDDTRQMQALLAGSGVGTGGGGCQAPAFAAVFAAIDSLPAHSSIYLFVDAGASDANTLPRIQAAAVARDIKVNVVAMGGCGTGTEVGFTASMSPYGQLTQGTSGKLLFTLPAAGAVQASTSTILDYEGFKKSALTNASGSMTRGAVGANAVVAMTAVAANVLMAESGTLTQARTVQFPVDSGITQMGVTLSAVGVHATLTSPAGQAIALTDFGGGLVSANILNPAAGVWTIALPAASQETYIARVEVTGGVLLKDLQYESLVEIGERSGHEYAPRLGSTPPSGRSAASVQLDGTTGTNVSLQYIDEGGALLSSHVLALVAPGVYRGAAEVPKATYWVKVSGTGQNGTSFARIWRGSHPLPSPPQGGLVVVEVTPDAWAQGKVGRGTIALTNLGADETVTLSARSNVGTVLVSPSTVTLAANTKSSSEISVVVSTAAAVGASAGLVVTIRSSTGARDIDVPIIVQAVSSAVSANGLVAYFPFDTDTKDASGNGNDGIINGGVSLVTGKVGKGAKLNGVNSVGGTLNPDFIRVPKSSTLQLGSAMSISYWIRVDGNRRQTGDNCSGNIVPGVLGIVAAKQGDRSGWYNFESDVGSTFGIAGGTGSSTAALPTAYQNFRHVAYSIAGNTIQTFVNGTLTSTVTGNVNLSQSNSNDLYIGVEATANACLPYWYPLDGVIDELRIYNRALTSAEVLQIYQYTGVGADTQAPTVATALQPTAIGSNSISLIWSPASDNTAVTSYKIYRDGALIATLGNVVSYLDTGVKAATAYSYTIVACDAAGNCSALSQIATATTPIADTQAPSVPTGLAVSKTAINVAKLNWLAATDNVGVASYKIFRDSVLVTTLGNVLNFVDQGLTANKSYTYSVAACDASGNCSGQSPGVVLAPDALVGKLVNLSTRAYVGTGDDVLIAGFIIAGGPKTVVVMAEGPNLTKLGVSGALPDPTLTLYSGSEVIAFNDNYRTSPDRLKLGLIGIVPNNDLESAIVATLQPGAYTAIVRGVAGQTGIALVSVHDTDGLESPSRLANISSRARTVMDGDAQIIAGFIVRGGSKQVLMKGAGPSLAAQGVSGALEDPAITAFQGPTPFGSSDNWSAEPGASLVTATGRGPADSNESALLSTLAEGAYTVIMRGTKGAGVGLLSIEEVLTETQSKALGARALSSNVEKAFANVEARYGAELGKADGVTQSKAGYLYRTYSGAHVLAVNDSGVPHMHYFGPLTGGTLVDLGGLSTWLPSVEASQ